MLLVKGENFGASCDSISATHDEATGFLCQISSADPVVALLRDETPEARELGLRQLDAIMDTFWPEISDNIDLIKKNYDDPGFPSRDLAALVASKVYYHLGDYPNALRYALNAGDRFDIGESSEYTNIIIAKGVAEYIRIRQESQGEKVTESENSLDMGLIGRLEVMVDRLIANSVHLGDEYHAIGIAIDCRRLDLVVGILNNSQDRGSLIDYIMGLTDGIINRRFCNSLFESIRNLLFSMPREVLIPQYSDLVSCLYRLNNHEQMAQMLLDMINNDDYLRVYQICYDLVDIGDQKFIKALKTSPILDVEGNIMVDRVKYILSGKSTTELHLQFLHRTNHTDLRLLQKLMQSFEQRNSILHNALVTTHGLMQAGTCCDVFIRDHLSWFGKASNWAKFSATASIGVIHKGYIDQYRKVLSAYLPGENMSPSHAYSDGGSLYAMGLILSNHFDPEARDLLLSYIRNESLEEPVHHGAALGLGLVCMGQDDKEVHKDLKSLLMRSCAVSGQSAAIAIGLLMLGSGDQEVLQELHNFAMDTQHEKISRACVIAMAMILYRRENEADEMITTLCKNNDPIFRYGGMFTYAMAYCGTGSCKAVKELLYASVSDVSDDVRRASVISLGFVLCNTPEEVPKVLKLLVASYNPHVRYGAALALGISCAAYAQPDVVRLLHTLSSDRSDFVRQGAFMALGLVLQQSNSETSNDIMQVRKLFKSVIKEKHQDVMAKFGAILGIGLMDAGGQNSVASLYSSRGNMRQEAVAGFLMFAQHWYWHPYVHFVCLTLQPTCLIGINKELKIPTGYKILCSAPAKMFDYIAPETDEVADNKKAESSVMLSISAKRSAWLSTQRLSEQYMDIDKEEKTMAVDDSASGISETKLQKMEISSVAATIGQSSSASQEGVSVDDSGDVIMASEDSATGNNPDYENVDLLDEIGNSSGNRILGPAQILQNPCKLVPKQAIYCVSPKTGRYTPVFPVRKYGIVMLHDSMPNDPEEYVACGSDNQEAKPFTPFEYKA